MKTVRLISFLTLALFTGANLSAHDTDIYVSGGGAGTGGLPLVMFSLDMRSDMVNGGGCTGTQCDQLYSEGWLTVAPASAKKIDVYRAVLKKVFAGISGVKVGLMVNHNQKNPSCNGPVANCSNGAYILMGFKELQVGDANGAKAEFDAKISAIPKNGNGHPWQPSEMFFELMRYLTGQGWFNAHNGWTDFCASNMSNCNSSYNIDSVNHFVPAAPNNKLSWDSNVESGANYINPFDTDPEKAVCQKVYTINFTKGVINNDDDSDTAIKAAKSSAGMGLSGLSSTSSTRFQQVLSTLQQAKLLDGSWNASLNISGSANNVTSFFFTDGGGSLNSWPSAGSGGSVTTAYDLSDPNKVVTTLQSLFKQILSVSTTFVAPSVAVNVYNRSQVLADVYIAMFQSKDRPRWPGNVKKLTIEGGVLKDVNGQNAVASDGRVDYDAVSFWTNTATIPADPKVAFSECPADDNAIAGADGRNVCLGGAGTRIPGFFSTDANVTNSPGLTNATAATTLDGKRIMFTEPATYANGTPTALRPLEATTTLASALFSPINYFGAATSGTCTTAETNADSTCNYILWARGINNPNPSVTPPSPVAMEIRNYAHLGWMMGDPLHSKPLAMNYGANTGTSVTHGANNPDIRLLVGDNNGVLHMFRNTKDGTSAGPTTSGYKTPAPSGYQDGVEAWAFMPLETMPAVRNAVQNVADTAHVQGVDGTPVVYVKDSGGDGNIVPGACTDTGTGDGDKVYAYFGLRRGGRAYYALDITCPDKPLFLWKITNATTGFAELGQTWSTPKVGMMVYGGSTTPRPVLIFGGGYDPNKDTHTSVGHTQTTGGNDSQGNAVFIVSATDGSLIWKAVKGASTGYTAGSKAYTRTDLLDSIPSSVGAVDSDGNGLIDRVYVGDTGGVLWRIDTYSSNEADWTILPLLSVGRHYSAAAANDRRFFNAPDYAQTVGANNVAFDAILIGTGDRENPKETTVQNYFYMYKDFDTRSGTLTTYNGTGNGMINHDSTRVTDITNDCKSNASACTVSNIADRGWKLKLECPPDYPGTCGEKNLAPGFSFAGSVYFTTYIPKSGGGGGGCTPAEGEGRLYTVSIQTGMATEDYYEGNNNSYGELYAQDRSTKLASGGIPAEVVSLGGGNLLRPDLAVKKTEGSSGMKTFWYEKYR